jgi:purine-binding chemotaxis protein CheW
VATVPHLIFNVRGSLYAIPAGSVREVFWLPEITPVAQTPEWIAGILNLRGRVVPLIDLPLRLGCARQPYRLSDAVVVLEHAGQAVGLIVNHVEDVRGIPVETMEAAPAYRREGERRTPFVEGVARGDEDLIFLLHLENLLSLPELAPEQALEAATEAGDHTPAGGVLWDVTPEERLVLRERARSLVQALESEEYAGLVPLAVVSLNGEYYGVDLTGVREFSDVRGVTPIPCCPPHIVGAMNLRGEILTLVDLRSALEMPVGGTDTEARVVVVELDDMRAGVLVDQVLDVVYLNPAEVTAIPSALRSGEKEYLEGTAPYAGKMLSILDLPGIFSQESWMVNEEV